MYCKLTPLQAKIYVNALKSPDFELFTRRHEKCDCGRNKERHECCYSEGDQDTVLWYANHMKLRDPPGSCGQCPYVHLISKSFIYPLTPTHIHTHTHARRHCMGFTLSQKLWHISQHLDMLKPRRGSSTIEDQNKHEQFLRQICDEEDLEAMGGVEIKSKFMDMKDVTHCTKMKATLKLLRRHKERGDKVLVFSSSCQILDILEQMVISQGYAHCRLDGSTALGDRQQMVS